MRGLPPRGWRKSQSLHFLTTALSPPRLDAPKGGRDVEDGTCNPCIGAKTATETIAVILDNAGFHFRASSPPPAEKAHEAGGRTKVGRPRLARPLSADYPVNNQFVLGCSTAPRSHPSKVTEALHALFGRRRRCPRPQIEGLHRCPRASWFCILSVLRDPGLPCGNAAGWNSRRPVKGVATR